MGQSVHTGWEITLFKWPYFGVQQEEIGDKEWTIFIKASNVEEALAKAKCILMGVETNPKVWRCGVKGLMEVDREGRYYDTPQKTT